MPMLLQRPVEQVPKLAERSRLQQLHDTERWPALQPKVRPKRIVDQRHETGAHAGFDPLRELNWPGLAMNCSGTSTSPSVRKVSGGSTRPLAVSPGGISEGRTSPCSRHGAGTPANRSPACPGGLARHQKRGGRRHRRSAGDHSERCRGRCAPCVHVTRSGPDRSPRQPVGPRSRLSWTMHGRGTTHGKGQSRVSCPEAHFSALGDMLKRERCGTPSTRVSRPRRFPVAR